MLLISNVCLARICMNIGTCYYFIFIYMCFIFIGLEFKIFKENYSSLCDTITDISELLKYFVAEKIISMDQQEEIKTCAIKSERVSKLLLNISGPLKAGDSNGFYTMLKIMKTHGVDSTQRLAFCIIKMVDESKLPNLVNDPTNESILDDHTKGLCVIVSVNCTCSMYTSVRYISIKTHDSELRGQEEAAVHDD